MMDTIGRTCKSIWTRVLPKVYSYLRRTRFVREVIDAETNVKNCQEIPPDLREGEREMIWVNQDESLFYVNDDAVGT